jgi:hypothetical protein
MAAYRVYRAASSVLSANGASTCGNRGALAKDYRDCGHGFGFGFGTRQHTVYDLAANQLNKEGYSRIDNVTY